MLILWPISRNYLLFRYRFICHWTSVMYRDHSRPMESSFVLEEAKAERGERDFFASTESEHRERLSGTYFIPEDTRDKPMASS